MDQLDGKQIKISTIADLTLVEAYIKANGARPFTNTISGIDPTLSSHLATKNYVDALFEGRTVKDVVRLATTSNIVLTGNQLIDGVLTSTGNRILVKDQTLSQNNGIYLANSSTWTRTLDSIGAGIVVPISEGGTNANNSWELTTLDPITLNTTPLSFTYYAGIKTTTGTVNNKNMSGLTTASDFNQACSTALVEPPARGGHVQVLINGLTTSVGNGIKINSCYFSNDGGTTAKTFALMSAGDLLYWVGSVAGYQISTTDKIDFLYSVMQ